MKICDPYKISAIYQLICQLSENIHSTNSVQASCEEYIIENKNQWRKRVPERNNPPTFLTFNKLETTKIRHCAKLKNSTQGGSVFVTTYAQDFAPLPYLELRQTYGGSNKTCICVHYLLLYQTSFVLTYVQWFMCFLHKTK
jgi:hypothetical protein